MRKCDSCGIPLGDSVASQFDSRYCIHCQDQKTAKLKSKAEVKEGSIKAAMKFLGKNRHEAEKMADEMLPKLPRWQE